MISAREQGVLSDKLLEISLMFKHPGAIAQSHVRMLESSLALSMRAPWSFKRIKPSPWNDLAYKAPSG